MKLVGVIFLIALSIFFLWTRKKIKINDKPKDSKNKIDDNLEGSKNKIWKKKIFYVYVFALQFFVLNFIYPGGLFEIKTVFWFFATRTSEKAVVLKKINIILEKDRKQKISLIQEKIKEIEKKEELSGKDKKELSDLARGVETLGTHIPKQEQIPPVAMKTLPQITRQITDDLRNSAYLSWKKPAGYGGATSKKQVVAIVKIDRLDENFLVFSNTEKKFSSTCNWKTAGFYQGSWRQSNKQGLIKLTPEYKNGEIASFCGAVGEGTNIPNVPCWVTATMPSE